jgi:hypothetical protein
MSVISIQVLYAGPAIPTGTTRTNTTVVVTDSAGAAQTFTLNGTEVPLGFIPSVTVAAGTGSIVLTDNSSAGPIGTPTTVPYTTGGSAGSVLQSSGATVVTITP